MTARLAAYRESVLARLERLPAVQLASGPSPVEELPRLSALLGGPRLLVKRDDALSFAFGGNKVRKLALVAAEARARGADTLVTAGGIQSNHARVTAATAARLGFDCVLVVNGQPPGRASANALLNALCGATIRYVNAREERASAIEEEVDRLQRAGRHPYAIPIGASTPLGAAAFVGAIGELMGQGIAPDVIVHATSSAGTQAGLVAGCALLGLDADVIGVSADDSSEQIGTAVRRLLYGLGALLDVDGEWLRRDAEVTVDDRQVGGGYGVATAASQEAIELTARTEGLFLDPTYTAKAMAAVIAGVRERRFNSRSTVLFWHTGGQVGLFA